MKLGGPENKMGGPKVTLGGPNVALRGLNLALDTSSVTLGALILAMRGVGIRGGGDKKRGRALGTPPWKDATCC